MVGDCRIFGFWLLKNDSLNFFFFFFAKNVKATSSPTDGTTVMVQEGSRPKSGVGVCVQGVSFTHSI